MKNKFKKFFSDNFVLIFKVLFTLIICGVSFGFAWLIAESDMPEWVKFWLLR